MPPAHAGPRSRDPTGREVDDRLVEDLELIPAGRLPTIPAPGDGRRRPPRHGGVDRVRSRCRRPLWPCGAPFPSVAGPRADRSRRPHSVAMPALIPAIEAVRVNLVGRVAAGDQPLRQGFPRATASSPDKTTAKSSPPRRATRSSARVISRKRPATATSRRSPTPGPSASLTALKRSRSSETTADRSAGVPVARDGDRPAARSAGCDWRGR